MAKKIIISDSQLEKIALNESDVSKEEVKKILKDTLKQDKDFEQRVKNIAADVVKNLFRTLWQKNGMYDTDIRR